MFYSPQIIDFMKLSLPMLLVLLTFTSLYGQENPESCSFDQDREAFYEKHPEALLQAKVFEEKVKKMTKLKKQGLGKTMQSYVVPVVFHVYGNNWPDDSQGNNREVTVERVEQALQKINEDFAGGNDPVDPYFSGIEGSMDIEFKLAQIDPDGNTTNGIIFHETKEGFGLNGTNDHEIAKYAWDNYKYFNIHLQLVLKSGSENNSGIAWFPNTGMSDEGSARVVYNGKYIIYSPPASSLTHEFGHFFGLEHSFNGGCVAGSDQGDLVADTPPTIQGAGCSPGTQNCFGDYVNSQNHMDYNPCESMFTQGQVTRMESFMEHPARVTLWQTTNHVDTGIAVDLGARVLFNYQDRNDSDTDKLLALLENFTNDGSILNKRRIKAVEGAQFAATGLWQEGVHYTTNNVPNGLTVKINATDNVSAEITMEGTANSHEESDSGSFTITLLDPAIVGGASSIYSTTGTFKISFIGDYETYYETFYPSISKAYSSQETNLSYIADFNSLAIGANLKVRIRNYDGNSLTIDNPDGSLEILCNAGGIDISYLPEGTSIGSSSTGTWLSGLSPWTSPARLTSASYSDWHGKTGYFGFRVPTITGSYLYGWLKARVSENGTFGEVISMGINQDIGNSIIAYVDKPSLSYSKDRFLESIDNDGTMGNDIIVDLKDDLFATTGSLVEGTHYTISNVPAGLQFAVTVLNGNQAKLSMEGTASIANGEWDYERNINFEFLDAAFASNDASLVTFTEYVFHLEYLGDSFSKILDDSVLVVSEGDDASNGSFSYFTSHQSVDRERQSYQMQIYDTGVAHGIKFISWRKEAIANEDYELTPLDAGTIIGPMSSWKNGREYYSGDGQHMIDSDDYQVWRGQTKYIGIKMIRSNRIHYGWIKMSVSSDGNTFRFLECGFSGTPDTPIKAGSLERPILLNPAAFLQGALLNPNAGEESLMRDDIRNTLLSTTSPYADGATCLASVLNAGGTSGTGAVGNDIVDWVFVELRDANDDTLIRESQSALIQRDGDIVGIDGISNLEFCIAHDDYYVVVKHRNHLGIMTANTVALSDVASRVDFTDANNQITYGTDAQTTFGVPSGVVAMWAGDSNGDGRLNYSGALSDVSPIRSQVFNDPNNSVFGGPPVASYPSIGYNGTDVDMDGVTVYSGATSDVLYVRNNIFNNPSNSVFGGPPTSTFVFIQQLPEGANF